MEKPTWVVFDIGGVLFDYKQSIQDVANLLELEDRIIMDALAKNIIEGELGNIAFTQVLADIMQEYNLHYEPEFVLDVWHDAKHWVEDTTLLLQELHTAGYSLAAFTNNWKGIADKYLKRADFYQYFSALFDSSEYGMRKPTPEFYHIVENGVHASGASLFFIDDNPDNIATAKSLDWQGFQYALSIDRGKSANDEIRKLLL